MRERSGGAVHTKADAGRPQASPKQAVMTTGRGPKAERSGLFGGRHHFLMERLATTIEASPRTLIGPASGWLAGSPSVRGPGPKPVFGS